MLRQISPARRWCADGGHPAVTVARAASTFAAGRSGVARATHWHGLCTRRRFSRMIRQERSVPPRLTQRSSLPPLVPALWLLSINLSGCAVVRGIFNAGVWVGVLGVCAVLALLTYGVSKLGRRS